MLKQYKNQLSALDKAITAAKRPVIVSHAHPDGDAIGSTSGLYRYLKSRGLSPNIVLPDPWPDSLAFVIKDEEKKDIACFSAEKKKAVKLVREADTIFCLDFNTFSRTESLASELASSEAYKILIDHHLYPDSESFDLVFSEIRISSASELVYHILKALPDIGGDAGKLPEGCGEALLTGMTTDTNNFANSVFPSTFTMASELLEAGVDRNAIIGNIFNHYRENRFRLLGHILDKELRILDNGVAYMVIDKALASKYDIKEGETEGFVNIPLGIEKVVMSVLAKEDEDRYRISVRSKSGVSANRFASQFFNGGGHEQASGGKLIFGTDIAKDSGALRQFIEDAAGKFMTEQNGK